MRRALVFVFFLVLFHLVVTPGPGRPWAPAWNAFASRSTAAAAAFVTAPWGVRSLDPTVLAAADGRIALDVRRGCEGLDLACIYAAGVLAMPVGLRSWAWGLALGLPALAVANVLRVVALLAVAVAAPGLFHAAHAWAAQLIMVLVTLAAWMLWARWAVRSPSP